MKFLSEFLSILSFIVIIIVYTFSIRESLYFLPRTVTYDGFRNMYNKLDGVSYNIYPALIKPIEPIVVMFSHGNAGHIGSVECYVEKIHELIPHADVLLYDYYGYGESLKTRVNIKSCLNSCITIYEYAQNKYKHIILWGESIGGGINAELIKYLSIMHANNDILLSKKVMFPVLIVHQESLFTAQSVIENMFPLAKVFRHVNYDLNVIHIYKKYRNHIPMIILHSKDDDIIPFDDAKLLFTRLDNDSDTTLFLPLNGRHCQFDLTEDQIITVSTAIYDAIQ